MARRNPNGYGSVTKLSGNRKKPWAVRVSEISAEGTIMPQGNKNRSMEHIDSIERAIEVLGADNIIKMANEHIKKQEFRAVQKQHYIGYFETRKEAMECLAEWNRSHVELNKLKVTFAECYEYMMAEIKNMKDGLQTTYRLGFDRCSAIHNMPMNKITLKHLQNIVNAGSGMSLSTIKQPVIVMHAVYDYAMRYDIIEKDYSQLIKMPEKADSKEKVPFTKEEIASLWNDESDIAKIILILIYTGMRIGELQSLTNDDIHNDYLWCHGTKNKASNRIIPLHSDIKELIHKVVPVTMTYQQINRAMKDYKHTPHECRHTTATMTLGVSNQVLRKYMLGHSQSGITDEVYTHPEFLIPELVEMINSVTYL